MTLGYLNRYNSKRFRENFPKFCVRAYTYCTESYFKFRVDTCNAKDAIQEKPRGGGADPTLP